MKKFRQPRDLKRVETPNRGTMRGYAIGCEAASRRMLDKLGLLKTARVERIRAQRTADEDPNRNFTLSEKLVTAVAKSRHTPVSDFKKAQAFRAKKQREAWQTAHNIRG